MIIKSCVGSVMLNTRPNPPPLQFIILSEERSLDYFVRPYVHSSDMQFSSLSAYRSLEHFCFIPKITSVTTTTGWVFYLFTGYCEIVSMKFKPETFLSALHLFHGTRPLLTRHNLRFLFWLHYNYSLFKLVYACMYILA